MCPSRTARRGVRPAGQLLLLLLTCALGCGVSSRGELTAQQCQDGSDDDGDQFKDCEDPDCWVYAFCLAERGDAVTKLDGSITPASDSSVKDPMGNDAARARDDDAGDDPIVPEFDASLPPETCGAAQLICAPDEICSSGTCKAAPDGSLFLLRVTSAVIPDQSTSALCFDTAVTSGALCSLSPAALCGACKPDPYVIVSINGTPKFQTSVIVDSLAPGWNEEKKQVALLPGDILRFTIRDHDPIGDGITIFYCEVEFTSALAASAGVLQCSPRPDMVIPPLVAIWAINAEYEPAPDVVAQ
jgi:C2 domain